jgi:hypothetical protein
MELYMNFLFYLRDPQMDNFIVSDLIYNDDRHISIKNFPEFAHVCVS